MRVSDRAPAARRKRPRGRRAAEQCDERAPPHSITSSAMASSPGGTLRPNALAVLRLIRSDHCHLMAYQIGCEVGQSIVLVLRPAILDRHILAFDIAAFADASLECGHKMSSASRRRAAEEPNHRHRWLLRARRERPCRCCATEQRDEIAPPHVEHGGVLPPLCANKAMAVRVGSPLTQGITERTAGPWATPEMF